MARFNPELQRKSGRIRGIDPINYNVNLPLPFEGKSVVNTRDYNHIISSNFREEYEPRHILLLGSYQTVWPHVNFEKTYDSHRGTTCHQCRQKTIDVKTTCTICQSIRGQFCGTCLQNRYGENLDEVLQLNEWICPPCRDICNCSICRCKKGLLPTGIMAPEALTTGFKSVAHYLIINFQKKVHTETKEEVYDVEEVFNIPDLEPKMEEQLKEELEPEEKQKYSLDDLKNHELVACRAMDGSTDKFWIARVFKERNPKRKIPSDCVVVQWFERENEFSFFETTLRDVIPVGSIFYKGFIMNKNKSKNSFTLQEDLSKYDD